MLSQELGARGVLFRFNKRPLLCLCWRKHLSYRIHTVERRIKEEKEASTKKPEREKKKQDMGEKKRSTLYVRELSDSILLLY